MGIIRRLMLLVFGLALSSLANYSFGQPTEIVVARNPGGPIDTLARELARALQQQSGGSVAVINKGGDNGKVAASYIRRFPGEQSKFLLSAQLAGAASHDTNGLTQIIVVGTSAAWSEPLTLFAAPDLSQAQVNSIQRMARAAIMSAPFAATAARLSVIVSAETSSTDPQAVAEKVAPIPAAQQTQDRKLTIGSTTRCPQSIQVVEQQYVNTYTYNANGTVAFRNNFGIVNQSWQTIDEASRQFEMMHRLQQERASAPIPTKDPFGNPIPPQPRFVPADYSAAITWARCHVGEAQREATNQAAIEQTAQPRLQPPGITPSQGSETNTAGRMHSGSARDMDSANTQSSVSRSNAGADGQRTNSQSARAVKFQSQDATTCVEIVPKGFKCDAMHDRFMTNICRTKISVRWRLGSDGWSQTDLAPGACSPLSPWKDDRTVQYKACSWDPKANYGPYSDPCRY